MDNPLLKYLAFIKTVEQGSFTRAARELDYAQSSISKMVADLESEWGMTLLERSKSGVCLTSAAGARRKNRGFSRMFKKRTAR